MKENNHTQLLSLYKTFCITSYTYFYLLLPTNLLTKYFSKSFNLGWKNKN